jgi:hypothetical protein
MTRSGGGTTIRESSHASARMLFQSLLASDESVG